MMRVAEPLAREIWGDDEASRRERWVLALCCSVFAFWFVNHDYQWYGIGAAAVMNVGLFSQAFGWHLMILHLGALLLLVRDGDPRDRDKMALYFALLLLTHTMTAVFSAFIVLLAFLWFRVRRVDLLLAHALGGLLAAFWIVPLFAYMGAYTGLDIQRPEGDFLQILLRYPYDALFRTLGSWLHGRFELLSPIELAILALFVAVVAMRESRRARLLVTFLVFGLIAIVVMTSGFSATSVRFGFHWYRFVGYLVLYLAVLLSPIPMLLLRRARTLSVGRPWLFEAAVGAVAAMAVGCFVATALLPHYERKRIAESRAPGFLANENAVLEYFKREPHKGRVITEYFNNYDKFPFLSCHVISARMLRETGFEPINGLFVQSSLSYHFPMGSANMLKANTYNGPLLFAGAANLTEEDKIAQLKELGVTHVVGTVGSNFSDIIRKYALDDGTTIGPYVILKLAPEPVSMVQPVAKRVAAYVDLRGSLPFKLVEMYFYGKHALTTGWELLEVPRGAALPPQTDVVILNGDQDRVADERDRLLRGASRSPMLVLLDFTSRNLTHLTHHYNVEYQHNQELDDFNDAATYLDKQVLQLDSFAPPSAPSSPGGTSTLVWDPARQDFSLEGLEPGRLYRINYSFFPYWHSGDGRVFRGSGDRIFFAADGPRASFTYAPYRDGLTWIGWLLTAAGALFIGRRWLAERIRNPGPLSLLLRAR
jgi:hypothetical protein